MFNKDAHDDSGSGRPGMIHRLVIAAYDEAHVQLREEAPRIIECVMASSHYPTSRFIPLVPGVRKGLDVRASVLAVPRCKKEAMGIMAWPLNKSGDDLMEDITRFWVPQIGQATLVVFADISRANTLLRYFVEHEGVQSRVLSHGHGLSLGCCHRRRPKYKFIVPNEQGFEDDAVLDERDQALSWGLVGPTRNHLIRVELQVLLPGIRPGAAGDSDHPGARGKLSLDKGIHVARVDVGAPARTQELLPGGEGALAVGADLLVDRFPGCAAIHCQKNRVATHENLQ